MANRVVHGWPVPQYDTEGNKHDVLYEQDAETGRARYVHLDSCWCKQPKP